VVLIAIGVLSFNAYASFTGADSNSEDITAGDVTITLADPAHGSAMSVAATDIAPGDTIERVVNLNVAGSVALSAIKLTTNASTSSDLDTDATHGLQVKIEICDQVWDPNDNGHPYECGAGGGGTKQTVLATRAIIGANLALSNLSVSAGSSNKLLITVTFPGGSADDDATFADDHSIVDFTFSGTQRAGTYK
jgi:hypothetical protein